VTPLHPSAILWTRLFCVLRISSASIVPVWPRSVHPKDSSRFSSERKRMASFHRLNGVLNAYVKGAPRQVLAVAGQGPDGQPLDDGGRQKLMSVNETYARAGLRVLALAFGPVEQATETALKNLTFVGFVGLMDPPAPGVRETIGRLRGAGLRTVMLTGDQGLTAEAVGQELGVLSAETQVIDATARGVAGRVSGRAPFGVSPPSGPEKRREAEGCAAVCREVTRSEALPEAGLVDRSDVANRQDGRASGRTTSAMPFFGLTEPARRAEMLPTTDRVAQLTAVRSAPNFRTALP
jgi:magnesium-transporting ATPase (P-type)